jgi:hypothetical protein
VLEDRYSSLVQQLPLMDTTKNKYGKQLKELPEMLRRAREQQSNLQYAALAKNLKDIESEIPKMIEAIAKHKEDIAGDADDESLKPAMYWELWEKSRFGMLGRTFNDGLMLFNSDPAGFDYKYGADAPYSVRYRGITPERTYITRMNWITKTIHVDGKRQNKETSYEVTHSSVFPGILLNINDKEFSFTYTNAHAKCPDSMGYTGEFQSTIYTPINPKTKKRKDKISLNVDKMNLPMYKNWLAFWFAGKYGTKESYPLELVFENQMEWNFIQRRRRRGNSDYHQMQRKHRAYRSSFIHLGCRVLTGEIGNRFNMPRAFRKNLSSTCDFWASAALQFPMNCLEKYWVDDSAGNVDIARPI